MNPTSFYPEMPPDDDDEPEGILACFGGLFLGLIVLWIVGVCLTGCTHSADTVTSIEPYADASTPVGLRVPGTVAGQDEFNAGIIADVLINGRSYNVITADKRAKLLAWLPTAAVTPYVYQGFNLWIVDKAVMHNYDVSKNGWANP